MPAVIANLMSESIFILQTAMEAALRSISSGTPIEMCIRDRIYTVYYLLGAESGSYYIIMNIGKQLLEHAMMSLTLLVGGALLFDYAIKRNGKDNS